MRRSIFGVTPDLLGAGCGSFQKITLYRKLAIWETKQTLGSLAFGGIILYLYFSKVLAGVVTASLSFLVFVVILNLIALNGQTSNILFHYSKTSNINRATRVLVVTQDDQHHFLKLERIQAGAQLTAFEYHEVKYFYNEPERKFELNYPITLTIGDYMRSQGLEDDAAIEAAKNRYGQNKLVLKQKPTLRKGFLANLRKPHVIAEFFSVFSYYILVSYFSLDYFRALPILARIFLLSLITYGFFLYALFHIGLQLGSAGLKIAELKTHEKRIQDTSLSDIQVYRKHQWQMLPVGNLSPGDLIYLTTAEQEEGQKTEVPCDSIVLRGKSIVTEDLTNGESRPKTKTSIGLTFPDYSESLDLDNARVKECYILGGSILTRAEILEDEEEGETGNIPTPDGRTDGCIAYVLKTGYGSTKGLDYAVSNTVNSKVNSYEEIERSAGVFILFSVPQMALVWYSYYTKQGLFENGVPLGIFLLYFMMTLKTIYPFSMNYIMDHLLTNRSIFSRLLHGVTTTDNTRFLPAGKLDVCCFDKTGTLTESSKQFHGIVELGTGLKLSKPEHVNKLCQIAIATAHEVEPNEEAKYELDQCMVDSLPSWGYEGKVINAGEIGNYTREVIVPFSHVIPRMTALVHYEDSPGKALLAMKGAPNSVKKALGKVPSDYDTSVVDLQLKGYYVLSLATAEVGPNDDVEEMQAGIEKNAMKFSFAGFLVLGEKLKIDATGVVDRLMKTQHNVKMITGDGLLTALNVARQLKIAKQKVHYFNFKDNFEILDESQFLASRFDIQQSGGITGLGLFGKAKPTVIKSRKEADVNKQLRKYKKTNDCSLALDETTLKVLMEDESCKHMLPAIIINTDVFAEVKPEMKMVVVKGVRYYGKKCLMCGDGLNDLLALTSCHVGIAMEKSTEDLRTAPTIYATQNLRNNIIQFVLWMNGVMKVIRLRMWQAWDDKEGFWREIEEFKTQFWKEYAEGKESFAKKWDQLMQLRSFNDIMEYMEEEIAVQVDKIPYEEDNVESVIESAHFKCNTLSAVEAIILQGRAANALLNQTLNTTIFFRVFYQISNFTFPKVQFGMPVLQMFVITSFVFVTNQLGVLPPSSLRGKKPVEFLSIANITSLVGQVFISSMTIFAARALLMTSPDNDLEEVSKPVTSLEQVFYAKPSTAVTTWFLLQFTAEMSLLHNMFPHQYFSRAIYVIFSAVFGCAYGAAFFFANGTLKLKLEGSYGISLLTLLACSYLMSWYLENVYVARLSKSKRNTQSNDNLFMLMIAFLSG